MIVLVTDAKGFVGSSLCAQLRSIMDGNKRDFRSRMLEHAGHYELVDVSMNFDNKETVVKMKEVVLEYRNNNSVYEVLNK